MIEKVWNTDKLRDRLQMKAIQSRRPLSCTIELTYRCNFNCKMCYVRMNDSKAAPYGRMKTVDEWLDMARQMKDAGVLYLTLTGGECTIYPGFERLYEELSKMGFRISIMSNAGAYTPAIRSLFEKFPPYGVAVTLYGGSNETYAAVTGDPRSLDKTLENIRFFKSIGVPVSLNFTMIQENVRDYPKIGKICAELGIPYTLITDITGHQKDPAFSNALVSRLTPAQRACVACHKPEEVEIALENAEALEKELANFVLPKAAVCPSASAAANPVGNGSPVPQTAPESPNSAPEMNACIGSYSGCALFWNGEMQTCISMNGMENVNPLEIGFENAWQEIQKNHAQTFKMPPACQVCELKSDCNHNCPARRFEGMGSTQTPDSYTCQYTYLLKLYREKQNNPEIPQAPSCS